MYFNILLLSLFGTTTYSPVSKQWYIFRYSDLQLITVSFVLKSLLLKISLNSIMSVTSPHGYLYLFPFPHGDMSGIIDLKKYFFNIEPVLFVFLMPNVLMFWAAISFYYYSTFDRSRNFCQNFRLHDVIQRGGYYFFLV